jgi:hypothetical protein
MQECVHTWALAYVYACDSVLAYMCMHLYVSVYCCLSSLGCLHAHARRAHANSLSHHHIYGMQVWDQDSFTAHDRIGIARCSLRDIQTGLEVPLMVDEQNHSAPNGVLIFETCRMELKYYKFGGIANPALIRFYAEHVWNLPKPEVNSTCLFVSLPVRPSVCLASWLSLRSVLARAYTRGLCLCARKRVNISADAAGRRRTGFIQDVW